MSQEQIDRERVEINFRLELLMEMLWRSKVDQRYGWSMKRKVKWHRLQVKWEHRVNVQLKEELLSLKGDLICEPAYGPLLFESSDVTEEKSTKELNQMKDSEQQGDMMTKASSETTRSYVFKTNYLCVIAGTSQGVEQKV